MKIKHLAIALLSTVLISSPLLANTTATDYNSSRSNRAESSGAIDNGNPDNDIEIKTNAIETTGSSASEDKEKGSGMATGRRIHDPVVIQKRIDKSSPLSVTESVENGATEGTSLKSTSKKGYDAYQSISMRPAAKYCHVESKDDKNAGVIAGIVVASCVSPDSACSLRDNSCSISGLNATGSQSDQAQPEKYDPNQTPGNKACSDCFHYRLLDYDTEYDPLEPIPEDELDITIP